MYILQDTSGPKKLCQKYQQNENADICKRNEEIYDKYIDKHYRHITTENLDTVKDVEVKT